MMVKKDDAINYIKHLLEDKWQLDATQSYFLLKEMLEDFDYEARDLLTSDEEEDQEELTENDKENI